MNLKEVYLRLLEGEKVAGIRDEFNALIENCRQKKKLLNDVRDGKISEAKFKEDFSPLLEFDDVLLGLEQKLLSEFPDNDELKMDIQVLRANVKKQKDILNRPAHIPLRLDQLRAVVANQFYVIYEKDIHTREALQKLAKNPLKKKPKGPKPAESPFKAEATGWQYPAGFFVDDPWGKPQAAFEFFKDIIWDIYRLRTEKYDEYVLKGSIQAWANKHLIAPFPDIDLYVNTLQELAEKSKRHTRVLGDIILEIRHMADPVTLQEPTPKRMVFHERWSNVKKLIKKLPAELQAFVKLPEEIISEFSEFLFTATGEVEPMIARPIEVPEGGSLTILWSPPPNWFEIKPTPMRKRAAAIRAAYFLFLVSDSVVRLIDDPGVQPQIIDELASQELPIHDPGNLGSALARIAQSQKDNRKVWSLLTALCTSLWRAFDQLPERPGYFAKLKLRKQRATLERIWDLLPQDVHEFLQDPVMAIEDMFAQAGVSKKAA